jgi:Cupin superfamily protein
MTETSVPEEVSPTETSVPEELSLTEQPTDDGVGKLEPTFETPSETERPPLVQTSDIPRGAMVTIPREGSSPFQDRLAISNAAARADSLRRLAAWFPGYDFAEAAQNVDSRRFMVIQLGDALVDHLDGQESVERLLLDHHHTWAMGGLTFSHGDVEGHQPPPPFATRTLNRGQGRIDTGGLVRAFDERWTAIINGADLLDPRINEVCIHLSRVYATHVNTNIYLSYGPSKGFGAHWDNHDTIIVPVCGHKNWALFEPAVLSAERPWIGPEVSDKPLWEGVIEPGMCLVIPRGWGHRVDGSEDLSIHYTIGVSRLEVHDVIDRVHFEGGFWPMLRGDVPYDVREPALSYGGSVFDDPLGFSRTIGEVATPELVERAVAAHRSRVWRLQYPSLYDTFRAVALGDWSGLGIRLNAVAGVMVHAESDDAVVLMFSDRAVRVVTDAVDAVAALADCAVWKITDLPPVGDNEEDRREELAKLLVTRGLATVEPVP